MFSQGKCPSCEKPITSVNVEDIDLNVNHTPKWKGFSYSCPYCNSIISVQMNPLTLNVDLVSELKK